MSSRKTTFANAAGAVGVFVWGFLWIWLLLFVVLLPERAMADVMTTWTAAINARPESIFVETREEKALDLLSWAAFLLLYPVFASVQALVNRLRARPNGQWRFIATIWTLGVMAGLLCVSLLTVRHQQAAVLCC